MLLMLYPKSGENTVYQEARGTLFMATYPVIHVDSSEDHRLDVYVLD